MKKRIFTARSKDVSSLLTTDVMRYAEPAKVQKAVMQFFKEADAHGRTPQLEYSPVVESALSHMRRTGMSHEAVMARYYTIDEASVIAYIRHADYYKGTFAIQLRSNSERITIDPYRQTVTFVMGGDSAGDTKIIRALVGDLEHTQDARYHNPDHKINQPTFLKAPRRLHDCQVPEGMELAVAMATDIAVWADKVYGAAEWKKARHEERLSIVLDVVTAHGRQYTVDSLAANAIMQLVDCHFSVATITDRSTLNVDLAIYNFNRQYIKE